MAEKKTTTKVNAPAPERTVRVIIPKVKGDDSDEIIGVNGKIWQIQRGKEVELPWSAYRQLKHKYRMEEEADDFKAKVAGKK